MADDTVLLSIFTEPRIQLTIGILTYLNRLKYLFVHSSVIGVKSDVRKLKFNIFIIRVCVS